MPASYDLSRLIKFAEREPWSDRLDACLAEHFEPAAHELGIDIDELLDLVGPEWEGSLWGCAFEDLLGRDIDGQNLVDDYLKRRGWNETAPGKAYMKALRDAPMSLYEVCDVVPGKTMRLRDLLQDLEPVVVEERSATQTLRNWDRIATRVIVRKGGACISGALLAFGPEASAQLIAGFANIGAKPDPELDFDVTDRNALLRHSAPLFTATWLMEAAGAMHAPMPELVNSDGEDILFHRIVFPLRKGVTQKIVARWLNTHDSLSPASAKFWNWLAPRDAKPKRPRKEKARVFASTMEDGSIILGNLELSGRFLIIEVNSAERAEKAKREFAPLLGDLVQAPLMEIRTVEQMLAEQAEDLEPDDDESEIPLEEMQRIVREMMDLQYRQVLDEAVPALDHKTPRQMARTKDGKAKVVEWLKYIENMTAKSGNPQMAGYSFAWMWDELGVAHLR